MSVIGYGQEQPVNYWLHNEFLLVDGIKMSKRYHNFFTLRDLEEKRGINYNPLAFRFLCMQTHYNKTMNFTLNALESAEDGLLHIKNQIRNLKEQKGKINDEYLNKFKTAINDDLNMSSGLAVLQEVLKSGLKDGDKLVTIFEFDKVLGLELVQGGYELYTLEFEGKVFQNLISSDCNDKIRNLSELRLEYRAKKNFTESDRLRDEIEKLGYIIEDIKDGQRIYKK